MTNPSVKSVLERLVKKDLKPSRHDLDRAAYNIEQEKNHARSLDVPDESCHHGGYLNLVNLHRNDLENCKEEFLPLQEFPVIQESSSTKDENSSVRSSTHQNTTNNANPNSCNSKVKYPHEHEITINEALRSIVNNDLSWSEIQKRMKDAKMYTSFGIREICTDYVKAKAEEMRAEKIAQAKRQEEEDGNRGSFNRLKKRLSMML